MSNDYFKAQGWFKNYATSSEDSRGVFQELVKEDEEAFRLASAETDRIKAMMNEKYGPGTIKYGSEIKQPEIKTPQAAFEFSQRNPAAEGGRMRFDNGLGVKKFTVGSGPGTGDALTSDRNTKIVKSALNKIKKQVNNKPYFEWSEKSDWYKKLQATLGGKAEGVGMNRDFTNQLINKVVNENFSGSYHGKNAIKNLRQDMVVNGFVEYLKDNREFDGGEKFLKSLEKFEGKDIDHKYERINRSWKSWIAGEFEVEGVDRAQLKKELKARNIDYSKIDNWSPNASQKRGLKKKAAIEFLDNQNNKFPNRSFEDVQKLYKQKFPDRNIYLDVNTLTDIKRTGIYKSGDSTTSKYKSVSKGNRANWLKESYGKQFQGNYSKLIKAADQLEAAGEFKKAKRISVAADKFFGPNGIITNAKGEGEHALARTFDLLNPDRQLAVNSLVSGDLNQFKKNFFDIPVKRYFDEYNNPETTSARRKELKILIEGRKSTLNSLTGGQTKGIVAGDIVKFQYAPNKIIATSNVEAIDTAFKKGNFNIDDYVARGTAYGDAFKVAGKEANIFTKTGDIKKTYSSPINENKLKEIESYITDRTGKVKQPMFSSGFAGAYEMLSDDLKPVLNNPKFKAFAKTVVSTPGKFFGIGDVVLGYLDYQNNISQGISEERSRKLAYQAMSFGAWRVGDQEYIKELKDTYLKQGGDESVFDQVINLNKQNADLMQTVENTKKNYKKNVENEKTSGNIIGDVGIKYQVDLPTASEQLKLDLNSIKSKAENMDKNFTTFKETYTGEDLTKPSKDIKSAAFENLTKERTKAFDTKSLQSDTEVGSVWNSLRTNLLNTQSIPRTLTTAVDFINPFTPLPKLDDLRSDRARYEAQLKEMKEKYPREFYLHNLQRGMDRDNPITVDAAANLMSKKELGFSEGGITGLRSKYEYKK